MKTQRGFTLVELLVVTAIVTIIALGAAATIFHISRVSAQNNNISTAVRQAQNTGYWLSHDSMMAENIVLTTPAPGSAFVTLGWGQRDTGDTYEVRYLWLSSSGSLYQIKRSYVVRDLNGRVLINRTTLIADNIESVNTIEQADQTIELTIVARSGNQLVTRGYRILPRINI